MSGPKGAGSSGARIVFGILGKDLREALRDSRILGVLLVPLALGLFYGLLFDDEPPRLEVTVGIVTPTRTEFGRELRATLGDEVEVKLRGVASAEELRRLIAEERVDVGIVLPARFDDTLEGGDQPEVLVLAPETGGSGAQVVGSALEKTAMRMAGESPPIVLSRDVVEAERVGGLAVLTRLGARTYLILMLTVVYLSMACVLALPYSLTEEVEKKTLDALLLVASYGQVVLAKALMGLVYALGGVAILMAVARIAPAEPLAYAVAVVVTAVVVVGIGLLIGGVFRSPAQLQTWGFVFLLPLIAPAVMVALPLPEAAQAAVLWLPTAHTSRLLVDATIGGDVFPAPWLSYLVLFAWGVAAYGLLVWRLRRRED